MPRACRRCQGDIWSRVWGDDGTGRAGLGAIAGPSAANDAQAFRTEVEAGLQAVVAKIMDGLFLAEAPADQSAQSY